MFGFLIGTICLVCLIKVLKGGGWGGWHRAWRGHRGGRFGRWGFLRAIFERLDTSPGQEKVIRDAVEEFSDSASDAKRELSKSREDLAKAMRNDYFDETLFGELFARHDTALEGLRKEGIGALARIHEVLDEKQRGRLADVIENGPGWFGRRDGGPYRSWA